MNFAIIYTIIILVLSLPLFITNVLKMIPWGVKIIPLPLAITLLWLYTFFLD